MPKRFLPVVEQLETRLAPATITVNSLTDNNQKSSGSYYTNGNLSTGTNVTLRSATEFASIHASYGNIIFTPGLSGTIKYNGSNPSIALSTSVVINATGANVTVDANGEWAFHLSNGNLSVTIENLTLTDGNHGQSGNSGGAIYDKSGTLTLINDTITDCKPNNGGAVYNAGTMVITGCTFENNQATNGGGINNVGTLTLTDSTITENTATSGAGIFNGGGGYLTLSGDTITGNYASGDGGCIDDSAGGYLTVSGGKIANNTAINSGGGIYVNANAVATVTDCTISENSANNGAGIFITAGSASPVIAGAVATIIDCTFSGNQATHAGGGFYEQGGTATITSSTFSGNSAGLGGAIYVYSSTLSSTFTAEDSTFTGNTAKTQGGGVFNSTGSLTFVSDTFTKNSARTAGGIFGHTDGNIKVFDTILDGNTGGDVYNVVGTAPNLGIFTSSGSNLYGSSVGVTWITNGNYPDIHDSSNNPGLGSLQNNGGPTQTLAELPGSLALSAGKPIGVSATDQRGFQRLAVAPALSRLTNGGNFSGEAYYYVVISYLNAAGVAVDSTESSIYLTTGNLLVVKSPAPVNGATDYNVYAGTHSGTETLQNGSTGPIAIGTNCTEPSLVTGGAAPPGIDIGAFQNQYQWFTQTGPSAQTATAGTSASFNLGSFGYTGSSGNLWTVDVNWGDGSADTVFSTSSQGTLTAQSHTYTLPEKYAITVTVKDGYNDFSETIGTVTVGGATTVNTLGDADGVSPYTTPYTSGGLVSLRSALRYINTNNVAGTIDFAPTLDGKTINLTQGNLQITDTSDLSINATGQAITVNASAIRGSVTNGGVFSISTTATDAIDGLTISGGEALGARLGSGGGVYNIGANLTLDGCTISGNNATLSGGGIYSQGGNLTLTSDTIENNQTTTFMGLGGGPGGGIASLNNTLTLTDDLISGNTSLESGGGLYVTGATAIITDCTFSSNNGGSSGGAIADHASSLTLANSTLADNQAGSGGGIYVNAGGFTATLKNDTIANNTAFDNGGGIQVLFGTVSASDCTLTGNSAEGTLTGNGGGGINNSGGTVYLSNDTVAGNNAAESGGGIYSSKAASGPGHASTFDTILDGNTANTGADVYNTAGSTFTSTGGNLYGNVSGTISGPQTGDQHDPNDNPGLGGLQSNGGPTQTMAVLPGSLAYQAGQLTGGPTLPSTDQRGFSRTTTVGANTYIDIGAFENQSQLFSLTGLSNQTATAGSSGTFNLGSFSYSGSAGNAYTVTVSWGDGTQTDFSANHTGSLGSQVHTYAYPGSYTLSVAVSDADNDFGQATAKVAVSGAITVNTLSDVDGVSPYSSPVDASGNGEISLRSALEYVNANNLAASINFTSGLSGTIGIGGLGTLQITDTANLAIDGSGANIAVSGGSTGSGTGVRVFNFNTTNPSGIYSVSHLTVTNGYVGGGGGDIRLGNGTFTLTDDTITNGIADGTGGGIDDVQGTLNLTNDTFSNNQALNTGLGGALFVFQSAGPVTVTGCTFAGNSAVNSGGAVYLSKGGLTLGNSTLTNNTATDRGGALFLSSLSSVEANNDTITANTAKTAGAIYNNSGSAFLFDTIAAGNTGSGGDIVGGYADQGGNLVGTSANPINPLLGALQNNGGPTQTMAPLPGSPALGTGVTAGVTYTTDQRGFQRIVNNKIDIGAFENQSQWIKLTAPASQTATAGSAALFNFGSFTYSGGAASPWTATVAWDDGTQNVISVLSQGTLPSISHTYTTVGVYTLTITVTDLDGNFAQTNTATVTVNPGPVSQLVVTPSTATPTAATPFTVTIKAEDANGNLVTTASDSITLTSTDPLQPLGGASYTHALVNGQWSFTVSQETAGVQTLTATDTTASLNQTALVNVQAGSPANVIRFSGNNQSAPAGGTLTNPLVVEVTDGSGNPIAGITVNWAVASGGGNFGGVPPVTTTTSTTNSGGLASIAATLGATAGSNTFTAAVGTHSTTFTETGTAGAVAGLAAVSGNNQSGIVGTNLNQYLVVEATDANGAPVPGVTITWSAATGGGSTSPVSAVTGSNGQASFLATLGSSPGTQTFSFSTAGVLPVTFTENATVWQGTSLGGYVTQVTSALDKNGHLELFGIGGDHALWYNVQTSGSTFTGWNSLGGYVKQITVATQAGGLLAVFAIGGDNAAYLITQNVGGTWTPGAYTDLGGYVQQLATGLDLNGHIELFGIGGDNAVWVTTQGAATPTGFSAWSSLGGYVKQITVGTNADGTLQVFGVGGDNAAWYRKQHSAGNLSFDTWTSLGGYVTQLATGLDLNHHLELFGIGGDNAIWTRAQTDSTGTNFSGWSSLGGYVTQIAVTTDQGDLDVFGIGADSAIWYRKQNTAENLAFDPYVRVAASIAQLSAVTDSNGNAALFAVGKAFSDGQFFDQV